MSDEICLSHKEVKMLTSRSQHQAQASALNFMGIDHKVRPDGSVMVLRSDIVKSEQSTKKKQPNFEAIGDVA